MAAKRASALSFILGCSFVVLGVVTTRGLGGRTVVGCPTYGSSAFRGVRFTDWTLVWFDGCNTWTVSLFAVLGGLYLLSSVLLGGIVLYRSLDGGPLPTELNLPR